MKTIPFLTFLGLSLALGSCSDSSSTTSSTVKKRTKVDQVVDRAIEWAGGLERWQNIQQLTYTKRSRLLLEDEQVEYDITQKHDYTWTPDLQMDINWETKEGKNRIIYTDSAALKYLNDSLISEGTNVQESAMSAFYVLGMPFKLGDPGIYLSYEGQQSFRDRTADVIKATYSPDTHDNHSTSDDWWYYFDAEDGAFLGCMVYHAPTYALIENIAFHEVEGLKFQKRRMSYRCDSLGNKQFLRAEFWYDDYAVTYRN